MAAPVRCRSRPPPRTNGIAPRGWNEFTARHPSRGCLPTDQAHRQDVVRSFRTEIKVVFRKSDNIGAPITDVQLPMIFNLIGDPGERYNLWEVSVDMGWVMRPELQQITTFQQSVAKFPNIQTGHDFKGYP